MDGWMDGVLEDGINMKIKNLWVLDRIADIWEVIMRRVWPN
jgi:hypothetical protein